MAPIKTFQQRNNYAAWLTEQTKEIMLNRDKAVAKARRTKDPQDWIIATALRNTCTRILRNEKYNSLKNKLAQCEDEKDISLIWKNIKGYLGWGGCSGAPTELTDPATGQLTNSPKKMAEIQNQYYIEKIQKIRQKLPPQGDPTSNLRNLMKEKEQIHTDGLSINTVSPEQINKIILELRNSKSCGLDNLDTYIVKLIRPHIIPAVTHIINTSISTQQFPTTYKSAKVVPLYKGKESSATQPKLYRPVAILPIISKILERVVHTQDVEYMNRG